MVNLKILNATFGGKNVTNQLESMINNNILYIPNNINILMLFGDPTPHKEKFLSIKYTLDEVELSKDIQEKNGLLKITLLLGFPNQPLTLPNTYHHINKLVDLTKTSNKCLEIGGPSSIFNTDIPVYPHMKFLDNIVFASETLWVNNKDGTDYIINNKKVGSIYYEDGTQINFKNKPIKDQPKSENSNKLEFGTNSKQNDSENVSQQKYDMVISSHCLEHIANPLKALFEWTRVLNDDGNLLFVVPWKVPIFDHKREYTTFEHILQDYENNVDETDLTHLDEILEKHDIGRDAPAQNLQFFRERCLNNFKIRGMHHHVFSFSVLIKMIQYLNLRLIDIDLIEPFHIIVWAQKCKNLPNELVIEQKSDKVFLEENKQVLNDNTQFLNENKQVSNENKQILNENKQVLIEKTLNLNKKLVLYAYHESEESKINLEFFCKHGMYEDAHYILIINGNECSVPINSKWNLTLKRENIGLDFGAWYCGLQAIDINNYNYFIFLNDTIRGPFYNASNVGRNKYWIQTFINLLKQDKVKLAGLTINCYKGKEGLRYGYSFIPHVQTMLWCVDREGLDMIYPSLINEKVYDKIETVSIKEIGISQKMIQHGYNISCILEPYQVDYTKENNQNINYNLHDGDPWFNDGYFGSNIDPYESIFFKTNREVAPQLLELLTQHQNTRIV